MTTTKTPVGIRAQGLTKRYGDKVAVDNLSFTAEPGVITGFLGPNGAGKSTTMRMLLGLVKPTRGTITIGGRHIAELDEPARTVGALLDARALHPRRTAFDQDLRRVLEPEHQRRNQRRGPIALTCRSQRGTAIDQHVEYRNLNPSQGRRRTRYQQRHRRAPRFIQAA